MTTEDMIKILPDDPIGVKVVVYNEDMIVGMQKILENIRGFDYSMNIEIITREQLLSFDNRLNVFIDPMVYDHIGNGLN